MAGLAAAGIALLALLATLAISVHLSRRFAYASERVEHTMFVKVAVANLAGTLFEAEAGQRGYVLTGRREYFEAYTQAAPRILRQVDHLRALTADNVNQQRLVAEVARLVGVKLDELRRVVEVRDRSGQAAAVSVIDTDLGLHTTEGVQTKLRDMEVTEDTLLATQEIRQRRYGSFVIASLVVASIAFGLFTTFGAAWSRTTEARRRSAEANAARLRAENEALAERQRTAQFQERFMAILGHDLRNPLSTMTMGLRLLRIGPPTNQGDTLDRLERSVARMRRMVDQLLDLARSRLGGGIPVQPASANLGKIVADVADEVRTAHPERSLVVEMDGNLDGEWDPDRLSQVVSNLVENAISHGADDHPVSVAVHGEPQAVAFAVHNAGPPLPGELARVLFDPFRRGERDSKTVRTSGLGLGLYIVHEIVTAHGGRIDVASNDSDGTTFTVELPRAGRKAPAGESRV